MSSQTGKGSYRRRKSKQKGRLRRVLDAYDVTGNPSGGDESTKENSAMRSKGRCAKREPPRVNRSALWGGRGGKNEKVNVVRAAVGGIGVWPFKGDI